MDHEQASSEDRAALAVPFVGRVVGNGLGWEPYRLVDADGRTVDAVSVFLAELQAAGRSAATLRSYALDLLRWLRFCWAVGVPWDDASRSEARDFSRWMVVTGKPDRPHWRHPDEMPAPTLATDATKQYAPSVRAHSETVLRTFYEFHREQGSGPALNPFPLERSRRGRRANGHHNPMEPFRNERVGVYRPSIPERVPRAVPDETFNEIFARLGSNRDRALVAFYVSTGARASELLSAVQGGVDPGRQLVSVVRKGSGQLQELPASTDAFVWLRLYQLRCKASSRPGGASRCSGRTADRSVRSATTPCIACSSASLMASALMSPCTRCATPPPTGWPRTRRCR